MSDFDQAEERPRLVYSKSSGFYMNAKLDYFQKNAQLLERSLQHNRVYASQPPRSACKICRGLLPASVDFQSHGVDYVFCERCQHLNGKFEDTQAFVEAIYITDDGSDYSKTYIDENFFQRVNDVYLPKVDFLNESVATPTSAILDVGCGGGHFVLAALQRSLSARGIDVSKSSIDFGNRQISQRLGIDPLKTVSEVGFYDEIVDSDANVVSAIGVIEHLREPHRFIEAFRKSEAEYIFYSVPMFSLSVVLENIFDNVFPRQLSGAHTHLFSEHSLTELNRLLGVTPLSEWRFGTDAMDLIRHIFTSLQENRVSRKTVDFLQSGLGSKIDDFQSILDKNHFCSEIHVVAKKE